MSKICLAHSFLKLQKIIPKGAQSKLRSYKKSFLTERNVSFLLKSHS
jgi:hypothetical protein